jgi:hypothetical protein
MLIDVLSAGTHQAQQAQTVATAPLSMERKP